MWQMAAVLLIVTVVVIYLVRHYAKVYRNEVPACSSCAGCCGASAHPERGSCDCPGDTAAGPGGLGGRAES